MGLFGMMSEDEPGSSIPIPSVPELSKTDLMAMEKETTGHYFSGHPMDGYRGLLRKTRVAPIGLLLSEDCPFADEQIVSIAGIIQTVKMKTTSNNSLMAYVTIEDDTASMEMLAFSNVLSQYGGYLKENMAVIVTGKFSLRDDKDPQIVVNRAGLLSDIADRPPEKEAPAMGTLYLRLSSEQDPVYGKTKAILNMFPGESGVVLYFADTKLRRGTRCSLSQSMLRELKYRLGEENVVVK